MKRRTEGNQGERKWDTEKWTKITLFQGENSLFVNRQTKKTKKEKGLGPTAPKHTCRVASTQAQKENAEKRKTRKEERGYLKDPFSNSQKRCRKKNTGKLGKTIRTPAASRFLATARIEPKPRRSCKNENAPKTSPIGPRPGKMGKTSFENLLSSAAPGRFLPSKPKLVKISNFRKNKFVRPRKICVKNVLQHQGDTTGPTQINQTPQRKIAPKPLVLKGFASYYLFDCAWKSPDQKHTQKTKISPDRKKRPRRPPKWHFGKTRKIRKQWGNLISGNRKKTISHYKNSGFKKGGRKWTHGGPQTNARDPFWGAANEPKSIHIYIYIYIDARELIRCPTFRVSEVN